jgi:hypothetical protein
VCGAKERVKFFVVLSFVSFVLLLNVSSWQLYSSSFLPPFLLAPPTSITLLPHLLSHPQPLSTTTDDAPNATTTRTDNEAIAKWTLWAIGNMVQLGKISQLTTDDKNVTHVTHHESMQVDGCGGVSGSGVGVSGRGSVRGSTSTSGESGSGGGSGGRNANNNEPSTLSSHPSTHSTDMFKDLMSSPRLGGLANVNVNVNQLINLTKSQFKARGDATKNTGRFEEAGLAGPLVALIR